MSLQDKVGIQRELRQSLAQHVAIPVITGGPDNAVVADAEISDDVIALLSDGDTVELDGNTWVFDAASVTADGEFRNAVELAAHIDALARWGGTENTGAVEIESDNGGEFWNNFAAKVTVTEDTTSGGGASDPGEATIEEATIAELAIGDTVEFDGNIFTMAAATSVADNEFENAAGLEACLDDLSDWGAVLGTTPDDIVITSAADGGEWNGRDVVITYNRQLENGANGTPGVAGGICVDDGGTELWVSMGTAGLSNASWAQLV